MPINRRDIIQILRDENALLKARNKQISSQLAHHQQAFRVLDELCDKALSYSSMSIETFDPAEALNDLLAMILHACNIENGSVILVDEEAEELEFVAVIGEAQGYLLNHRMSLQAGVVGHVIDTQRPTLIENVHTSKEWLGAIDERLDFHTQSLMCVPLKVDDRVIGAIEVVNHTADVMFNEYDLSVLRVATRLVSFALEKVEVIALAQDHEK